MIANEMQAGLELDMAVTEAIGAKASVSEHDGYRACLAEWPDGSGKVIFRPSTHWQDAMFAADMFRLLDADSPRFCILCRVADDDRSWLLTQAGYSTEDRGILEDRYGEEWHGETGPLAICRAILGMLEVEADEDNDEDIDIPEGVF
jgi:hypothetical protein